MISNCCDPMIYWSVIAATQPTQFLWGSCENVSNLYQGIERSILFAHYGVLSFEMARICVQYFNRKFDESEEGGEDPDATIWNGTMATAMTLVLAPGSGSGTGSGSGSGFGSGSGSGSGSGAKRINKRWEHRRVLLLERNSLFFGKRWRVRRDACVVNQELKIPTCLKIWSDLWSLLAILTPMQMDQTVWSELRSLLGRLKEEWMPQ